MYRKILQTTLISILISIALGVPPHARAENPTIREVTFDIPAQPLVSAILAFSAQTGLQVVTSGANVSTAKTAGVTGRLRIDNALEKLLTGTGLKYRTIGETTVTLMPVNAKSTDAKGGTAFATENSAELLLAGAAEAAHVGNESSLVESGKKVQMAEDVEEMVVEGEKVKPFSDANV